MVGAEVEVLMADMNVVASKNITVEQGENFSLSRSGRNTILLIFHV